MASSILTSTAIESCISSEASPPSAVVKLLEISLISAQDLAPVSKSMQTYAVAWVDPTRKRTTQTDPNRHRSPEWTEKFIFRLHKDQIETASLTVEIYTISWFRDVMVGTVRVSVKDLIAPLLQTAPNRTSTHFMTLQLRRPSGGPHGKIHIGVALLDSAMRSTTMKLHHGLPRIKDENYIDEKLNEKIQLWRSMSAGSDLDKEGWENGSDLCSDVGPSASVVAEQVAKAEDGGSSILEVMTIEEAKARGRYRGKETAVERGRKGGSDEAASEISAASGGRGSRRHSDGGLFSCIAYGIEFTIVCGASKKPSNRKNGSRTKNNTTQNTSH